MKWQWQRQNLGSRSIMLTLHLDLLTIRMIYHPYGPEGSSPWLLKIGEGDYEGLGEDLHDETRAKSAAIEIAFARLRDEAENLADVK